MGVFRVVDRAGVGFVVSGPEAEDAALVHPVAGAGGERAVRGVDAVIVTARVECLGDAKDAFGGIVRVLLVVIVELIDAGVAAFRSELLEFVVFGDREGIGINVWIIHN